jgi:hypothetical protein
MRSEPELQRVSTQDLKALDGIKNIHALSVRSTINRLFNHSDIHKPGLLEVHFLPFDALQSGPPIFVKFRQPIEKLSLAKL